MFEARNQGTIIFKVEGDHQGVKSVDDIQEAYEI